MKWRASWAGVAMAGWVNWARMSWMVWIGVMCVSVALVKEVAGRAEMGRGRLA